MESKDLTSIYIKPSRRKCSASDYKCFDLYNQDMVKIPMKDVDVIDIEYDSKNHHRVSLEIVDNMIHIWSHRKLKFEPIVNTFIVHCPVKQDVTQSQDQVINEYIKKHFDGLGEYCNEDTIPRLQEEINIYKKAYELACKQIDGFCYNKILEQAISEIKASREKTKNMNSLEIAKEVIINSNTHIANSFRLEHQDQVIKECIKLLNVDGENAKIKVKELLEDLVK